MSDAIGIMELQVVSDFIPAGDHEVVICDVKNWKFLSGAPAEQAATAAAGAAASTAGGRSSSSEQVASAPLYTGYLRSQGYL